MSLIEGVNKNEIEEDFLHTQRILEHSQARAKLGSWETDPTNHRAWWSAQMYVLFGRDPELGPPTLDEFLRLVHPQDRGSVRQAREQSLSPGQSCTVHFRTSPELGPVRQFVEMIDFLVEDGRPMVVGTTQDITQHKVALQCENAESLLRSGSKELAEQFAEVELLYRTAPVGLCLLDTQMRYLRINERLASLNGLPVQQHIGKRVEEILPEIAELMEPVFHRVVATGEPALDIDIERPGSDKPEDFHSYVVSYHPLKDSEGSVIAISIVVQDITKMRRAERDLMMRQEAIDKSVTPTAFGDAQFRISYVNQAFLDLFGFDSADQVIGQPNTMFASDPVSVRQINDDLLSVGSWSGETNTRRVDGQPINVMLNAALIRDQAGKPISSIVTIWDITDRKHVQASLRESEYSLARAQQLARIGNWEFSLTSGQLSGSAEIYRIIGLRQGEIPSFESFVAEHIHPDDQDLIAHSLQDAISTGQPRPLEFRLLRISDQDLRYVRADAELVCDNGQPRRIVGTLQDVTEQKRVELALRESEEKFRVLTERSPVMVVIARAGRIVYCNPTLAEVTGYALEELQQMSFLNIIHPEFRDFVAERHRRRLAGEDLSRRYEIKILTKQGQQRWFDLSAQLIDFESEPAVLVACVDITERKAAEQQIWEMDAQLAHVSRLSMMGEMVAGIAHEINQPLSAIANFAAACRNTINASGHTYEAPIQQWLDTVNQQAVRCGDIIRRLRKFVKKEDDECRNVDLNSVVNESIALISSDLRQRSIIQCQLPERGPIVYANHVQIQQVLVNLLRNACDAVKDQDSPRVIVTVAQQDAVAQVSVQDNGPGIEPADWNRLFDAFYTTKPGGMGMGLAISKSIMESLDGRLQFSPVVPNGAKFVIQIPTSGIGGDGA